MPSNFDFLRTSRPEFHESATEAERTVHASPRGACVVARYCLEQAVIWVYSHDEDLRRPLGDNLATLIYEPSFVENLARGLDLKVQLVHKLGNTAAHRNQKLTAADAQKSVAALHSFLFWLAKYYGPDDRPLPPQAQVFRPELLPRPAGKGVDLTPEQLAALEKKLAERDTQLAAHQQSLTAELARAEAREAELQKLAEAARRRPGRAPRARAEARRQRRRPRRGRARRPGRAAELAAREAELAAARGEADSLRERVAADRKRIAAVRAERVAADPLTFDEAETRAQLIDVMLREAGWPVEQDGVREVPVKLADGSTGFADYVFWSASGLPLAVIEAKKTSVDATRGKNQAEAYADALERKHGQRPVLFYTNGHKIFLWDDARGYPPRPVAGFYTPKEIETLIARRGTQLPLAGIQPDSRIAGREYQLRALRAVAERFERDRHRRALLVMATGTGKTRTAAALIDMLQRAGWARRVLFLADRITLVRQTVGEFRKHLPHNTVLDLTESEDTGAPIVVSTYPTMLGRLERPVAGQRLYSPGSFDLVIIDEAHRSVYQRYRALLEYFDGFLLGLTATPRDEVDRDTYALFHLESGDPTFSYELADAVADGHLVPAKGKRVPFRFLLKGITYDQLKAEEQAEYESKLGETDGKLPRQIDPAALNRWLFNQDTVDKALQFLMEHGIKVDGGEQLGKTIIFARSVPHARYIVERFDHHYPRLAGTFARVIVSEDPLVETLVDKFKERDKQPTIAVSVDMLDTGVDVPEIVNLVFFKPVFSRVKFSQMLGRGTRPCPDLFGPGKHKTEFLALDLCSVFDFFRQLEAVAERETPIVASPSTRLFRGRIELLRRLEERPERSPEEAELLTSLRDDLHRQVQGMHHENFFVRPHWPLVRGFAGRERWDRLEPSDLHDLRETLATLPSENADDNPDARDFDLRCVALQIALLEGKRSLPAQIEEMVDLAGRLLEKRAIPQVAAKQAFIESLQNEETWQRASVSFLETVRRELRQLVGFIDPRKKRAPVYTNFEDELLSEPGGEDADIPLFTFSGDLYRRRVTEFIRGHQDHLTIAKLRANRPLTPADLDELERLLLRADVGESKDKLATLYGEHGSMPAFIRSLVGLDRAAVSEAFSAFMNDPGRTLTATQSNFVRQIIDYLTHQGVMEIGALYEPPFSDHHAQGPEGLFPDPDIDALVHIIRDINSNASFPAPANDPGTANDPSQSSGPNA
jgi:type I restriction enzyme R subunit